MCIIHIEHQFSLLILELPGFVCDISDEIDSVARENQKNKVREVDKSHRECRILF